MPGFTITMSAPSAMSSSTSQRLVGIGAVHLVGALVAGQGFRRTDGVAERAVEGGGVFGGIGHDLHVEEAGLVQRVADGADAAVHHV
jgi:hypothetical protein